MMWTILKFAVVAAMLVLMSLGLNESTELAGVEVPLWIVMFVAYGLGVLALYTQLRAGDRIRPGRGR